MRSTASALRPQRKCSRRTTARECGKARLETLLFFFDFPAGLLLLFAALLASSAKRPPLARLDLPARVHREDEEGDDPDHAAVDGIRLPKWLTDVDRLGNAVLGRDPRIRF